MGTPAVSLGFEDTMKGPFGQGIELLRQQQTFDR
jgi:hypothetical protein